MTQPHLTRKLGVSYLNDSKGHEGLQYSPGRLTRDEDEVPPEPVFQAIQWQAVQPLLDAVRERVEHLLVLAQEGHPRGKSGIETVAKDLSAHVLPKKGLIHVVEPGLHPRFTITGYDAASLIPWEVLEEHYYVCPGSSKHQKPFLQSYRDAKAHPPHCPLDGQVMEAAGGWLVLHRHLTHLVHGGEPARSVGAEFLIIFDPFDPTKNPKQSLCRQEVDPEGRCAAHCGELYKLLTQHGYQVHVLRNENANLGRVKEWLAKRSLVGLYFFGHGCFPEKGDQGFLQLADGPLLASQIEDVNPSIRFVFLNACHGADVGRQWTLERKSRSVAQAFGRGPGKVVIAPLWPVLNVQAAATALEFFAMALTAPCLADALRETRLKSFQRYQDGQPDISWLAYRYLGDANKTLPVPHEGPAQEAGPLAGAKSVIVPRTVRARVFDPQGQFNSEVFGFDVGHVLARAVKRRNSQRRPSLTVTDLLAGLIRRGDLTRHALRELGLKDLDQLYEEIGSLPETEPDGAPKQEPDAPDLADLVGLLRGEAGLREFIHKHRKRWLIDHKDQFNSQLHQVLVRADEVSQERAPVGEEHTVSERDVLEVLTTGEGWPTTASLRLPPAAAVRHWLDRDDRRARVDDNGRVRLDFLDAEARRIVEIAHDNAQQRGVRPIGNRLMAGAFLANPEGWTRRFCRDHGIEGELLGTLLTSSTDRGAPDSFALSPEVCAGVVEQMLVRARELAGQAPVTEALLFRAFCQVASPELKHVLLVLPWPLRLDLAALAVEEEPPPALRPLQDHLEEGLWRIVLLAARVAQLQGGTEIRSPHLLAALLGDSDGALAAALKRQKIDLDEVRADALGRVPSPQNPAVSIPWAKVCLGANAGAIMNRSHQRARSAGRAPIAANDLTAELLRDQAGIVAQILQEAGVKLPLQLGHDECKEPGAAAIGPMASRSEDPGGRDHLGVSPLFSRLGSDLTEKARQGLLREVVDRDNEIEAILQSLLLTENANVLLVGEAGVGKTAIICGVARRLAHGPCPRRLGKTRLVEVAAASVVAAGCSRADLEEKLRTLFAEAGPDVVLVLEEFHALLGNRTGAASSYSLGDVLTAALASGAVRIIATTTPAEYERTVTPDKSLVRRFQVQRVVPPSREAAIRMLSVHVEALQKKHEVRIPEGFQAVAVDLSGRYVSDRQWPGKAKDVLDRACAIASCAAEPQGDVPIVTREHVARAVAALSGIQLERILAGE